MEKIQKNVEIFAQLQLLCMFTLKWKKEGSKEFQFRSETEAECQAWVHAISNARYSSLLNDKEQLEQKYLHLSQIVESESTAKWQYSRQCEELSAEVQKLRQEICQLKRQEGRSNHLRLVLAKSAALLEALTRQQQQQQQEPANGAPSGGPAASTGAGSSAAGQKDEESPRARLSRRLVSTLSLASASLRPFGEHSGRAHSAEPGQPAAHRSPARTGGPPPSREASPALSRASPPPLNAHTARPQLERPQSQALVQLRPASENSGATTGEPPALLLRTRSMDQEQQEHEIAVRRTRRAASHLQQQQRASLLLAGHSPGSQFASATVASSFAQRRAGRNLRQLASSFDVGAASSALAAARSHSPLQRTNTGSLAPGGVALRPATSAAGSVRLSGLELELAGAGQRSLVDSYQEAIERRARALRDLVRSQSQCQWQWPAEADPPGGWAGPPESRECTTQALQAAQAAPKGPQQQQLSAVGANGQRAGSPQAAVAVAQANTISAELRQVLEALNKGLFLTDYLLEVENSEELRKIKKVQSFFRGWLCRRRWKQIVQEYIKSPHAESMRKRNNLVFKMVECEEEYVEQLTLLIGAFLRPLKMAASSQRPALDHDELNSIFLNSETLLFLHQIFLKGLTARMESWPTLVLGDLFNMLLPMLTIYQEYVRNHHFSLQVLAECKQRENFAAILRRLEEKPHLNGRTLETFLTYPMHQIPRYIICLHEILAHTPHNHVERKGLYEAQTKLEELSRQMHDEVSETENIRQNLAIERMIIGGCDILLDVNQGKWLLLSCRLSSELDYLKSQSSWKVDF